MFERLIAGTVNRSYYLKTGNVEYCGSFREDFIIASVFTISENGLYKHRTVNSWHYSGEQYEYSSVIPFLSDKEYAIHKLKGSKIREVHLRLDMPLYEFHKTIHLGHAVFKSKFKVTGVKKWIESKLENFICDD